MFTNFTEEARKVLMLAHDEMVALKHSFMHPPNMILRLNKLS